MIFSSTSGAQGGFLEIKSQLWSSKRDFFIFRETLFLLLLVLVNWGIAVRKACSSLSQLFASFTTTTLLNNLFNILDRKHMVHAHTHNREKIGIWQQVFILFRGATHVHGVLWLLFIKGEINRLINIQGRRTCA